MEKLRNPRLVSFFLLALLLHLSLLTSLVVRFKSKASDLDLKPLPAYIYREEKFNPQSIQQTPVEVEEKKPVSKMGIEKPIPEKKKQAQSKTETLSMGNGMQNINLNLQVKNQMDKPLLNLITKSVAAHLVYPKSAIDFRVMGRAMIGFILYPDGHLTDVTLMQSSGAEVLDQAALAAINNIAPVKNVNFYLKEPEPMMMGIIFQ